MSFFKTVSIGFLAVVIVLSIPACGETARPDIKVFNNTDALLCLYEFAVVADSCDPEVKPHSKTVYSGECSGTPPPSMQVVLIAAEGRREVYRRTELCREWKEWDTIIIEQQGDELVITDSLPDE
jgi:hypothetical protein